MGDMSPSPAIHATTESPSRGRVVAERASETRSEFQRDRDRIIHCGAFRRLALKTQVFLPDEGDHYRTRLTHTLEVAQIARTISRMLGRDDDLTEALSLAHDLGHSPFGHTGEDALDAIVAAAGGFDHNAQTLRIVTTLEKRYPDFDGLNLTLETLDGLMKRNGPLTGPASRSPSKPVPGSIVRLAERLGFALDRFPGLEAQIAAVADDIAYNAHDLEDGLDAGLFRLEDLGAVPWLASTLDRIAVERPNLDSNLTVRSLTRTMVGLFVEDAIAETRRRLDTLGTDRPEPVVGELGRPVVALSADLDAASRAVKAFLMERMYRHPRLMRIRAGAGAIVTDLASRFIDVPGDLPKSWRLRATDGPGSPKTMRFVADYVAGLTDRGAVAEHRRLFRSTPDLR